MSVSCGPRGGRGGLIAAVVYQMRYPILLCLNRAAMCKLDLALELARRTKATVAAVLNQIPHGLGQKLRTVDRILHRQRILAGPSLGLGGLRLIRLLAREVPPHRSPRRRTLRR